MASDSEARTQENTTMADNQGPQRIVPHTLPQRQQSTFLQLCTQLTMTSILSREHRHLKQVKHLILPFEC